MEVKGSAGGRDSVMVVVLVVLVVSNGEPLGLIMGTSLCIFEDLVWVSLFCSR